MDFSPQVVKLVLREFQDLQEKPCGGIRVFLNEHKITEISAEIDGPVGTPYEGGLFKMKLVLSPEFPTVPPKGYFLTKIFHPNVSKAGEICVNVLKKDWEPQLGIRHVLMVIRCLLIEPYPESALNEEAGKLLLENYEEYARHAKLMASLHAQPPKKPMPLTVSGANACGSVTCQEAKEEASSPAKKAKPELIASVGGANLKLKKSLKRL